MAQAGARVCHVDAAKGMVDWAKMNLSCNKNIPDTIRWIIDDVIKFLNKESKRKETYDGIVLDPPSFGRGPKGQVWKIESSIIPLLEKCRQVLSSKPLFILLSLHSHGFSENTLERILKEVFGKGTTVSTGEMTIIENTGSKMTAGNYAKLLFN
jgi:23S rRNA (cytosine1962-C5)-methyltransferase